MINMQLANQLGLSDATIAAIKYLQERRVHLKVLYSTKVITSKEYVEEWTSNEYRLQELWGFPKDPNYHRFWEMAGCTCPKMDNEDAYPTGYYTRSGNCPLHGEHTWQK